MWCVFFPRQTAFFVLEPEIPLLDEGPEILGPELSGSSGRRRHGASVKTRDGVPQKGPCVSRMWQDGRGREAEGPLVAKTA